MSNSNKFLFLSVIFLSACGTAGVDDATLAQTQAQIDCEVTKPLPVKEGSAFPAADADVFQVVSSVARANCMLGGFGWRVSTWDLKFEVKIKNLAYDKRFVMQNGNDFGDRTVFNPAEAIYLGVTTDGFDRFEFHKNVYRLQPLQISVIMPAAYNQTPNIGNPVAGWFGPTYGVSIQTP